MDQQKFRLIPVSDKPAACRIRAQGNSPESSVAALRHVGSWADLENPEQLAMLGTLGKRIVPGSRIAIDAPEGHLVFSVIRNTDLELAKSSRLTQNWIDSHVDTTASVTAADDNTGDRRRRHSSVPGHAS